MNNDKQTIDGMKKCLDDYMARNCKTEIDDQEANCELERNGLLDDDRRYPGKPLRELLSALRDSNSLPCNIKETGGRWHIRHSKTIAIGMIIFQF